MSVGLSDDLGIDGVQIARFRRGEGLRTFAAGREACGRTITDAHLHAIHCAGKPIIAVTLAMVMVDHGIDLDTNLASLLGVPEATPVGQLTLRHVLSHRTGLYRFATPVGQLVPPTMRTSWLLSLDAKPGHRQVYDDYVGWLLLQLVIERLCASPLRHVVRSRVLEPWNLSDDLFCGFDAASYRSNVHRIAVSADCFGTRAIPRLIEKSPRSAMDVRSSLTMYATARGLACFYASLGEAIAGSSTTISAPAQHLFRSMTEVGPSVFDPVLRRRSSFGQGFMTNLREHSFGDGRSTVSYGHSGLAGATLGMHDPATGDSLSIVWSAVIDPFKAVEVRRPCVVDYVMSLS